MACSKAGSLGMGQKENPRTFVQGSFGCAGWT
jgi:hypothetical protein